jgi:predicted transcriptional regulator of viral defense system
MEQFNLRTLGPLETKVVLTLCERGRKTVDLKDIQSLVGKGNATRNVIQRLTHKGWITRLRRGRFLLLPPEYGPENLGENNLLALATSAQSPSYAGWWSAASFHGFTTQMPLTAVVAVRNPALDREIEGSPVHFVRLTERKFFGFELYPVYGREVPISSPVKTLIDCLDRPALAGGATEVARIASVALAKVSAEEAVDTAIKFGSKSLMQRLGALCDLIARPLPAPARERLRASIPKSARSRFGRGQALAGDIGYLRDWGLYVDAQPSDLLAEVAEPKTDHAHNK